MVASWESALMRFNKVCSEADWDDPVLRRIMAEALQLRPDFYSHRERKHWEWGMGMLALQEYGYLHPQTRALGVACGHETFLYTLANHIKLVVATDLYGRTPFLTEADPTFFCDASRFAPFPYRRENLLVCRMDATALEFGDEQFDVLFSFSSVEHFGTDARVVRSMQEAYRVLRPGGCYVLSVDYAFQLPRRRWWQGSGRGRRRGFGRELLTASEIHDLLIRPAGYLLAEDITFEVKPEEVRNVYDLGTGISSSGQIYPHIYLHSAGYLFTSLFLVLFKGPPPPRCSANPESSCSNQAAAPLSGPLTGISLAQARGAA